MDGVYPLKNAIKHYDWGSPEFIPTLLQIKNAEGKPHAELWMGAHPSSPSLALDEGALIPLDALIDRDKRFFLGEKIASEFDSLPYLFKLLAAKNPLSLQAHPNLEQAKRGFARENQQNRALDDRTRNYKDANHKPEMLCAISPFRVLCGFRAPAEIAALLKKFDCPALSFLGDALRLEGDGEAAVYASLVENLFSLSAVERGKISDHITNRSANAAWKEPEFQREWDALALFNRQFPLDPAVLAPLYLNLIDLQPEEAIFLPAGVLHSYVWGFGVELMANSDNVLRGGLTRKYVNVRELVSILKLEPFAPQRIKPSAADCFEYPASAAEFRLALMKGDGREQRSLVLSGPAILAVIEGSLVVEAKGGKDAVKIRAGESVFIAAEAQRDGWTLTGTYTLYGAHCPAGPAALPSRPEV
jgi:mannose-6-phosphate isomerase